MDDQASRRSSGDAPRNLAVSMGIPTALLCLGAWLCVVDFDAEDWGGWMHYPTFTFGALLLVLGSASFVGALLRNANIGCGLLVLLFTAYLALFWTYPGWLLLYNIICNYLDS